MENKWIDVKERLPEETDSVLAYNGNHLVIGYLSKEFEFIGDDVEIKERIWKEASTMKILEWKITHWQTLPEAP